MSDSSLHKMASDVGEDAPLISFKVLFSGLSFLIFGLIGLFLSCTICPLLYLLPIAKKHRQKIARRLILLLFPLYVRFMEWSQLIKLNTHNCETLHTRGKIVIANHPSLLDVVYLLALIPQATCIVKRSLFFNPFTAGVAHAAGFIRNDSTTLLEDCAASLRSGAPLIVFPEGTRTDPNKPFHFLRGTANIALTAEADLLPLVIRCRPARLMKHQAWYEMSKATLRVDIEALPVIPIEQYLDAGKHRARISRKITADLEALYSAY